VGLIELAVLAWENDFAAGNGGFGAENGGVWGQGPFLDEK
jgi:hypothetical protein